MAESLDDGEFWLPPQFLADDFLFSDSKTTNSTNFTPLKSAAVDALGSKPCEFAEDLFPLEFPYGFDSFSGCVSSDLISPADSLIASAEHSDEEDLLTCKMDGLNDIVFGCESTLGWTVSGSPQSTLCGAESCCRCRKLTSDMCSKVSSPPTWDLIGEVARMRMDEENRILNSHSRGMLAPQKKSSPVLVNMMNSNPDFSFVLKQQSIEYHNLQAAQFRQLRQQQMLKQLAAEAWGAQIIDTAAVYPQQQQTQALGQARGKSICGSTGLWTPVQQAQRGNVGSGMRAVFLANRGAKNECAGTGVFLPRQTFTSAKTESRKKSACSTVLLPAKVVQALKLDDNGQKPHFHHRLKGTFHSGENTARPRNCNVQKRNLRPQPEFNRTEARLPQDWTY